MKHPFHTLFYIGFSVMLFTVSLLVSLLVKISDMLPLFSKENVSVINTEVIKCDSVKLSKPITPEVKPIQKVLIKQSSEPKVDIPVNLVTTETIDSNVVSTNDSTSKTP
jgi:hypothetical protein